MFQDDAALKKNGADIVKHLLPRVKLCFGSPAQDVKGGVVMS